MRPCECRLRVTNRRDSLSALCLPLYLERGIPLTPRSCRVWANPEVATGASEPSLLRRWRDWRCFFELLLNRTEK